MKAVIKQRPVKWDVATTDPPILTREDWLVANVIGGLLVIMALLQLVSFADFRDTLGSLGVSGPTTWGIAIMLAELIGAAGFFRFRLSFLFRVFSAGMAILASGFWFVLILQAVSSGYDDLPSSGLFGRFLNQSPGWWTVLEATVLLFAVLYAVALTRYTVLDPNRRAKKVK